ncbi:PREDICTED: galanin receptor type 2-like [Acropora digitifera]|uniref:galanin receptor type 2-like n=1 Tax=Acropora digitifera TaxID=70779 RepID=UPI00077B205F|nr:PREDICTED: galanin receptor type 2-like [Acropora digitifera]
MPNETETGSPAPMLRSTWLTVFVVELVVISIINGFTFLTFVRNRHLRKRTTYLIINLTIADFFVGTVTVPMHIYHTMTFESGSGFGWGKFIVKVLEYVFPNCSLLNLALLSLERLHATLFPFRHSSVLDWVYFKAVVCIWFLAVISASASAALSLIALQASKYVWASLIIAVLFTVIVSYVIIALNVNGKAISYSSGAVSSDRKLTVTLLVVIVLSTLAILPMFFYVVLNISTRLRGFSAEAKFNIRQVFNVLLYANSFVNPLVYTLRMKEFRKATRVWCSSQIQPAGVKSSR